MTHGQLRLINIQNLWFVNNRIHDFGKEMDLAGSRHVFFAHNRVSEFSKLGIAFNNASDVRMVSNDFTGLNRDIWLRGDNVLFAQNRLTSRLRIPGPGSAENCLDVTVEGNTFDNTSLDVYGAENLSITNNRFVNAGRLYVSGNGQGEGNHVRQVLFEGNTGGPLTGLSSKVLWTFEGDTQGVYVIGNEANLSPSNNYNRVLKIDGVTDVSVIGNSFRNQSKG